MKVGIALLFVAAFAAFATAFAHMSCIYFGPACYSAQMAPVAVVESAKAGTLLAPLGTLLVAAIFVTLGCYALSSARVIRPLPKVNVITNLIALVCIIRGLLPIQLAFRHPDKVSDPVLYVGVVWLLVGLCFYFGNRLTKLARQQQSAERKA